MIRAGPEMDRVAIQFALAEDAPVVLTGWDLLGRPVVRAVDAPMAAGRHAVPLDVSALVSGAYIVRLTAGNFDATRRLAVVR